jgi:N-acyl-D-glutamate deacylase
VNGVIVVKDSEVLPVKAGKQIRFPIQAKGRFTPINKEDWRVKHTIGINPGLSDIHVDDSGAGVLLNKEE